MPRPFADRLADAIALKGNPCCVGFDPRLDWLPDEIARTVGLRPTAESVARAVADFHRRILDRIAPIVPAVKPQLAFFEQLGAPGVAAYEEFVRHAHALGLLVIADAKRGDIGPTADAYARAFLGGVSFRGVDLSPPAADAITIQPYFGTDGVAPFLEACDREGAGVFVLVKTSNPSSSELQDLACGDAPFARRVAELVARWGTTRIGASGYSSVGAVVGATHPREIAPLRAAMPHSIFLLPGYGAQGARGEDVIGSFDERGRGAIVVAARSVQFAFRRNDGAQSADWLGAIETAARAMVDDVCGALARSGKVSPRR